MAIYLENLRKILKSINKIGELYKLPTIFPIHPRTKATLGSVNLNLLNNINFKRPQKNKEFLNLIKNSNFVISDSGGLQEESAIYRKPLLIPRDHTERPEMLNKFNRLVRNNKELYSESKKLLDEKSDLNKKVKTNKLLYGKEESVEKIINILEKK